MYLVQLNAVRKSLHYSVWYFSLQVPGFGFRLIGSLQEIFGQFPFRLDLLHVRVFFLRQDIRFNLPAPRHLPQLRRMVAIFSRRGSKVLLAWGDCSVDLPVGRWNNRLSRRERQVCRSMRMVGDNIVPPFEEDTAWSSTACGRRTHTDRYAHAGFHDSTHSAFRRSMTVPFSSNSTIIIEPSAIGFVLTSIRSSGNTFSPSGVQSLISFLVIPA